ncbi:sensor histidine kinase [Desulfotruncus alcoholivorax]|uniref:sensor histidine kinase n=1 Tax=Desulfotruncus alcoholivorax TaxID=265477 RepID=UPI00048241FB|nr:HAMP domain-containing sensor histidine kinase [Desulfotruncus alcoholivorax]
MDTKLKNIKYSTGAKTAAFIVVWLCVMCVFGSGMFLLYNHSIISSKSYYDTYKFKTEFNILLHNIVELKVKLKSEESIKSSGETEDVLKNNLQRYYDLEKQITNTVNFAYYIKNTQTGETITNVTKTDALALIQKQPSAVYYNQLTYEPDYPFGGDIKQLLTGTPYEVYAAVIEPLKQGDVFYDDFMTYSKTKTIATYVNVLLVTTIILMILAFIYLVVVTGRQEGGEITIPFVDRIYTDVYSVLVFIAALMSLAIARSISFHHDLVGLYVLALVFGIDVLIGLSYILSMIRQIKSKQVIKNTLIYIIFDLCFNGRAFKAWTLLLLLGYGALNGILFAMVRSGHFLLSLFAVFLLVAFNIAAIYFSAKSLLSLSQIMKAVKEISTGNIDYVLDKSEISVAFSGFAENIQSIQGGLKKAVAEAIKGERMKTDLIANVSHDLKTPLTSIINYVDLLKKEDLNSEKAKEYLSILEEKSARLKQLIEDLIEASKASSGNLAIEAEKVDLHELVMQACGEYEEKINKAELDVHINTADKNILISADGKHMWRIIENLLSNVVKYSLPHTRVYINIAKNDLYGLLIIKNIAASPLDIPPEQLTERFVRGDASRTTEGSGLGLSIAQSLTNIQGGRFKIEIDGDLFKVIIEIPLWSEK